MYIERIRVYLFKDNKKDHSSFVQWSASVPLTILSEALVYTGKGGVGLMPFCSLCFIGI